MKLLNLVFKFILIKGVIVLLLATLQLIDGKYYFPLAMVEIFFSVAGISVQEKP